MRPQRAIIPGSAKILASEVVRTIQSQNHIFTNKVNNQHHTNSLFVNMICSLYIYKRINTKTNTLHSTIHSFIRGHAHGPIYETSYHHLHGHHHDHDHHLGLDIHLFHRLFHHHHHPNHLVVVVVAACRFAVIFFV